MRIQATYVEYILIILMSATIFYLSYVWYYNNFKDVGMIIGYSESRREITSFIDYIKNLQSIFSYDLNFKIKSSGYCVWNMTFLYYSDCPSYPYEFNSTEIIYYDEENMSYYIKSPHTGNYYLIIPHGYRAYLVCLDGKRGFLINTTRCEGFCIEECRINAKGSGEMINVTLG